MSGKSRVTPHRRFRPRGVFVADAVAGLALVAVLATVIVIAVHSEQRGSDRLAESRGATWAAEAALVALQSGRPAPAGVKVERIETESTPHGYSWVRVRVERSGRAAELVGLIPTASAPGKGGQQ